MRTQQEILDKYNKEKDEFFSFAEDLIPYLSYENALPILKTHGVEMTKDEYEEKEAKEYSIEAIKKEMLDYLDFAFDKADRHRGLSAGRSIEHYEYWVFLLNDEKLQEDFDNAEYKNYGVPKLAVIAEYLGVDFPEDSTLEAMRDGEICPECKCGENSGCG